MKRIYTQLEKLSVHGRTVLRIHRGIGMFLTPLYLLRAWMAGSPGIGLHIKCGLIALKLLINRRLPRAEALNLAFYPFDCVRYFEFDVFWEWLHDREHGNRYLDISSPRLFFLLLLKSQPQLKAFLLNPDKRDMATTQDMLGAFDLNQSCRTFNGMIADANRVPESFDIITSISVIEHIPEPDDIAATKQIWQLLRPGGRLLISVPCSAEAFEQYVDFNEYGILETGDDGYVYAQRFYDEEMLQTSFFDIIGRPARIRIYGERQRGFFMANRVHRGRDALYPFWRESLMMGRDYRYFEHVRELPGIGVIAMEFVKPE
jgi:SAM-dependent methyltransferase